MHRLESLAEILAYLNPCTMVRTARAKPVRTVHAVDFKDRLDDQQHSRLHHPIPYRGYTQRVPSSEISTGHIYRGILPFVIVQIIGLAIVVLSPQLATWLPKMVFGP